MYPGFSIPGKVENDVENKKITIFQNGRIFLFNIIFLMIMKQKNGIFQFKHHFQ